MSIEQPEEEWYDLSSDRFFSTNINQTVIHTTTPLTICLHIGYKCNLACYYCSSQGNFDENSFIYLEQLSDFLKKYHVIRVVISGGEPFIYQAQLLKILKIIKQNGAYTFVSTNGTLKNMISDELLGYIDWIDISLPATYRDLYKKIRGADYFDDVIKFIHFMRNNEKRLRLTYTVNSQNINDVYRLPKFASDLGIKNIRISHTYGTNEGLVWDLSKSIQLKSDFELIDPGFIVYTPLTNDKIKEYEQGYLIISPNGMVYHYNTKKENFLFSLFDANIRENAAIIEQISKHQARLFYKNASR